MNCQRTKSIACLIQPSVCSSREQAKRTQKPPSNLFAFSCAFSRLIPLTIVTSVQNWIFLQCTMACLSIFHHALNLENSGGKYDVSPASSWRSWKAHHFRERFLHGRLVSRSLIKCKSKGHSSKRVETRGGMKRGKNGSVG